ncbi:hypothetical protein N7468_000378 [Penicillium chermesinum]|uniref:Tyrosyl-DNA phosphodiesterase n=1 Tax=Penicillium chermesinum TaxID=63820 RepID=A0A9W9PK65_9EURO|nr:uncharacterized protein N7468_000378 [Penicillium chermesinum]KAJ5248927.1 hypothetical protein N7468_000378 [Penicillium chermesinum]KAJ6151029.1 hypothetical protein N7470_007623 [Penicillium chermesinum]
MDDDEDLQAAIRASLAEYKAEQSRAQGVVDLTNDSSNDSDVQEVFPKSNSVVGSDTDDDSDGDLKKAIAMSIEQPDEESKPSTVTVTHEKPQPMGISGLGLLDRQKMEEERLARLSKRKAEKSMSPPGRGGSKALKFARQLDADSPDPSSAETTTTASLGYRDNFPSARPGVQFPHGIVKKTCLAKTPRVGDDITIEEVIQRSQLKFALLSSFLWDTDWLFSKIDMDSTKLMLVMSAKTEEERLALRQQSSFLTQTELVFPPMNAQSNCMHSKLMLLCHTDYLRIVVPTANLTRHDWGESGLMENTVFLIDLPRRPAGSTTQETPFYLSLVDFMKASGLSSKLIDRVGTYDFAETMRYAFVHSIGGTTGPSAQDPWKGTGYCGLGRAVSQLGLQSSSPINIDYITSSIGSLNEEFLRAIYLACKGDDGMTEYTLRNTKSSKASFPDNRRKAMEKVGGEWKHRLNVYFPSDRTAHAAHARPLDTAGTICFQEKWWKSPSFPRHVLKDCESRRGALMHNKLIYVWPDQPISLEQDNMECKGWVYIGSANISESAWGRLVKDRATAQPKMNCRNWECGVVYPIITRSSAVSSADGKAPAQQHLPVAVFNEAVPVPIKVPAESLSDERPPWFFMGQEKFY